MIRRKIFGVIEKAEEGNLVSLIYDIFMIVVILLSLLPLAFKEEIEFFVWTERITTVIFIVDYILRWATADLKLGRGISSFFLYPITMWAIIDLFSILPSVILMNASLKALKVFRLVRALRVFKAFKAFRYSKNIEILISVFKKQKRSLITVAVLAVGYIFVSALIIFNVEPETFESFFDAIYWATVSLTTVGYGDIYTVTVTGKIITMISAFLGIAIVALPAGIITAGYMNEISREEEEEENRRSESNEASC